jgi:hypothetical protein
LHKVENGVVTSFDGLFAYDSVTFWLVLDGPHIRFESFSTNEPDISFEDPFNQHETKVGFGTVPPPYGYGVVTPLNINSPLRWYNMTCLH